MREKLLDLMKNEGLKPSQLAELLGINPAGISHILAGRNKPGFDLLQKILRRFPRINPDWLLLDSDKMYRDENTSPESAPAQIASPQLQHMNTGSKGPEQTAHPADDLFGTAHADRIPDGGKQSQEKIAQGQGTHVPQFPTALAGNMANVKRIVVLYDDQTFESFTPTTR